MRIIAIIMLSVVLSACGGKKLESYRVLHKAQIYETSEKEKAVVFSGVLNVLYSLGYKVTHQNLDYGTITAMEPARSHYRYTGKILQSENLFLRTLDIMFADNTGRGIFTVDEMESTQKGVNVYVYKRRKSEQWNIRFVLVKDSIKTGRSYKPESQNGTVVRWEEDHKEFREKLTRLMGFNARDDF